MELHWDVNISYAKEVRFLSVLFYCDFGQCSVRYQLQCIVRMNGCDVM